MKRPTWLLTMSSPAEQKALRGWQEELLNLLSIVALLAGGIAFLGNAIPSYSKGEYLNVALFSGLYIWIILLAIGRRSSKHLAYMVRAIGFVALIYAAAIVSMLTAGLPGDTRIWLMGFILLTTLLLGFRAGAISIVIGLGTFAAMGWMMVNNIIPRPQGELTVLSIYPTAWVTTGASLTTMVLVLVFSLLVLMRGMGHSLSESLQLTEAITIEREHLRTQTKTLQRRVGQIRTANAITSAANTILDPAELLPTVANLIQKQFDLYYVGVFLLDDRNEYAVLQAGTGDAGKAMLAANHRLPVGEGSMIGWSIANLEPRIALDVGEEAVRFENPHLPLTRSELALPMINRGQALGALTIQSVEERAFDEEDLLVLKSIADNLAIALANTNLFQQIQSSLEEAQSLHRQYLAESWGQMTQSEPLQVSISQEESGAISSENTFRLEVPLMLRGQEIGQITMENDQPWTEDQKGLAQATAQQAALALENARLMEETQNRAQAEQLVGDISGKVRSTLDIDQMMQVAVREMRRALNLSVAEIYLEVDSPTID